MNRSTEQGTYVNNTNNKMRTNDSVIAKIDLV